MTIQKLLLIDDCQSVHSLLKVRLQGEFIEIDSADSGEQGIALAESWRPDLILLDVEMPEVDGFEVCRRLKSDPETMQIPVIFLTGSATTEQKIRGLELGAIDYIAKPFDAAELRARVRAALRTKYLIDLLAQRAQLDGLTGTWNRAYLDTRLVSEQSLARRIGRPLSCIMIDIDRFKLINDTHGHPFGDDVIRAVAHTLVANVRTEDVVCRYGGEEFAVLLPNTDASAGHALAERLRNAVEQLGLCHGRQEVPVTCSVGVASMPANPLISVVGLADRALYEAKQTGRNRVCQAA